jgi:hypothetical protein
MERVGEKESVGQWKRMTVNKRTEAMNEKDIEEWKERVWLWERIREMNEKENTMPRKGMRKKRMERSGEKERVWQWKRMTVNKRTETMNEKDRVWQWEKNGKERVW